MVFSWCSFAWNHLPGYGQGETIARALEAGAVDHMPCRRTSCGRDPGTPHGILPVVGRLRTALFRVVLPMAMPGIICAVLFAFTLSWNEFLYSLVFIQAQEAKTIGVGVFTELIRGDVYYWGSLMAACFAGTIPIVVLYSFFMDYYVSGLTSGAIK